MASPLTEPPTAGVERRRVLWRIGSGAPVRAGLEIALALRALYLEEWQASKYITLLASRPAMDGVLAGEGYAAIAKRWAGELKAFGQARAAFLLYD